MKTILILCGCILLNACASNYSNQIAQKSTTYNPGFYNHSRDSGTNNNQPLKSASDPFIDKDAFYGTYPTASNHSCQSGTPYYDYQKCFRTQVNIATGNFGPQGPSLSKPLEQQSQIQQDAQDTKALKEKKHVFILHATSIFQVCLNPYNDSELEKKCQTRAPELMQRMKATNLKQYVTYEDKTYFYNSHYVTVKMPVISQSLVNHLKYD